MKNFIHEIHRRSLWQIIGIYLAVSWIVLQVVDVIGNNFGLPDWVAPAALVLLLLGLPVVIATAFVQEGMTTKEPPRPRRSLADAGEVAPPPPETLAGHSRWFTWKNALLGGGAAFVVLAILTAGYLFMRTAGIGPAGTLVAQGVLDEGAEVVLAQFDSSDPDLSDVVTGALRIDLVQSPTIRLVPGSELSAALARMERDEDAPITSEVARELAVREGYGAIIQGEIGTVGSGYVLTASVLSGKDAEPLAAFRATAKSEDDLIDAIESLSRDIRDKAGESLRSVQRAPGLRQVTTGSLDALRVYTRAEAAESTGDESAALEGFERAVDLDPDFAMAYRKIAVNLGNQGIRRPDEVAALKRAVELRDRLPETERYLTEAYYASQVVGDRDAAIRAYENLIDVDPSNTAGLNNLANLYRQRDRLAEAEALLERALAVETYFVAYQNLADARYLQGDALGASATWDSAVASLPQAASRLEASRLDQVLSSADYARADSLLASNRTRFTRPMDLAINSNQSAQLAGARGRLREAEDHLEGQEAGPPGFFSNPILVASRRAQLSMVRGDRSTAVGTILDAVERHRGALSPGDRFYAAWIPVLLAAGDQAAAADAYEEWVREVPETELGAGGADGRRAVAAELALAAGDIDESLRLWRAYERDCPGSCAVMAALGLARTHDRAGDAPSAVREFERYLESRSFFKAFIDVWQRAPALERMGQLYDAEDDPENAAKYYAMFVELWAEADEELQPRVRAAQARLEAILSERG